MASMPALSLLPSRGCKVANAQGSKVSISVARLLIAKATGDINRKILFSNVAAIATANLLLSMLLLLLREPVIPSAVDNVHVSVP